MGVGAGGRTDRRPGHGQGEHPRTLDGHDRDRTEERGTRRPARDHDRRPCRGAESGQRKAHPELRGPLSRMQRDELLDRLIAPSSVAVVGAAARPGGWGLTTIENLAAVGFQGPVFPVNPRHETIAGLRCYPDLDALPSVPDVAVVAVPAAAVPDTIGAAMARGIPAAVVYASGFGASGQGEGGDAGAEGPRARLLRLTGERRIAVLGPNCLGAVNYARRSA